MWPIARVIPLGAGAASAFFTTLRPWLLGLSVVLLGLGFGSNIGLSNVQSEADS